MKRHLFLILLMVWLLAACNQANGLLPLQSVSPANSSIPTALPLPPTPAAIPTLSPTTEPGLTLSMLQNAEYHSNEWGDFQLVQGVYYRTPASPGESPDLYSTQLFQSAFGDLNGDGLEEAAVILQTHNGGSGDSKELAVVLNQGGRADSLSTLNLGSMSAVEALQIQAGIISLTTRVLGPQDPLCCPSQQVIRQFRLENNQLVQLP